MNAVERLENVIGKGLEGLTKASAEQVEHDLRKVMAVLDKLNGPPEPAKCDPVEKSCGTYMGYDGLYCTNETPCKDCQIAELKNQLTKVKVEHDELLTMANVIKESNFDFLAKARGLEAKVKKLEGTEAANDFWKDIICTEDGKLDVEQVQKELLDYHFIMEQIPSIYMHVTGGMLSKHMYEASTIISVHDDHVTKLVEESVAEETIELKDEVNRLRTGLKNIALDIKENATDTIWYHGQGTAIHVSLYDYIDSILYPDHTGQLFDELESELKIKLSGPEAVVESQRTQISGLQVENEKIRNQWHIDLNDKVASQAEVKGLQEAILAIQKGEMQMPPFIPDLVLGGKITTLDGAYLMGWELAKLQDGEVLAQALAQSPDHIINSNKKGIIQARIEELTGKGEVRVKVAADAYHGEGTLYTDPHWKTTNLDDNQVVVDVMLENGNAWEYPVECVGLLPTVKDGE